MLAENRSEIPVETNAEKRAAKKASEVRLNRRAAEAAVAVYNSAAEANGYSICQRLTDSRIVRLTKRLADIGGIDQFKIGLSAVPLDAFLSGKKTGRDGSRFILDIDRLLSTESQIGDVLARMVDLAQSSTAKGIQLPRYWWQDPAELAKVDCGVAAENQNTCGAVLAAGITRPAAGRQRLRCACWPNCD